MGKTYNYKNVMEQHKEHKTTPNAKKKIKYKKETSHSICNIDCKLGDILVASICTWMVLEAPVIIKLGITLFYITLGCNVTMEENDE